MISARVQLRVTAVIYALFGIACLIWIAIAPTLVSSLSRETSNQAPSAIPFVATWAIACFVLSGLSLCFLMLDRSWRIRAIVGSLLLSLVAIWAVARFSAEVAPVYWSLGERGLLAIKLGTWWGIALAYSLCSFLLWKQLRASNNRWRGP